MKKLSVFLILLLVLSCSSTNKKTAKKSEGKTATETVVEAPKVTGPVRTGQYYPSTGVFIYKKERLILKDKEISYNLIDNTGLLENITEILTREFDLQSYEYINLDIQGEIKDGTIYVDRIVNYRAPADRYQNEAIIR